MAKMDPGRGAYFEQVCTSLNLDDDQRKIVRDFMARAAITPDDPSIWMLAFVAKHELASMMLLENIKSLPELLREINTEIGRENNEALMSEMKTVIRETMREFLPSIQTALPSPAVVQASRAAVSEDDDQDIDVDDIAPDVKGDVFLNAGRRLATEFAREIEDELDVVEFKKTAVSEMDPRHLKSANIDAVIDSINRTLAMAQDVSDDLGNRYGDLGKAVEEAIDGLTEERKIASAAIRKQAAAIDETVKTALTKIPAGLADALAEKAEPQFVELRKAYENRVQRAEVHKLIRFTFGAGIVLILMLMAALAGGFMLGQNTLSAKATDIERMVSTDTGRQWYGLWKINEGIDPLSQCTSQNVTVYNNSRICTTKVWIDPAPASLPQEGRFQINPLVWLKTQFPFGAVIAVFFGFGALTGWVISTRPRPFS
ncbi:MULTISPECIES: LapA family protein [unclassified Pannonibacter]|uniref:LapA family protein n=1 Tax=unclassified Pannonibacter TaxID=2627228 RepID=UPI00164608F8|nr:MULTISPECIES: LapA family protein [unclassified Pannonibacter]